MNKRFLAKIGMVIILLLAFFGYNVYSKWQNSHFKVDSEAFDVKKNFQAVMDDEYQAFPPLKLADHFNLTEAASQTVQIPKRHRQLKIHKIWSLPYRFYILYSLNLKKSDQNPEDIPQLQFNQMILQTSTGKTVKAEVDLRNRIRYGEVYHHRIYRSLVIHPRFTSDDFQNLSPETFFQNINKITLKGAKLIWKSDGTDENQVPMDELKVSAGYSKKNKTYFTAPIHQSIKLKSGQTFTFDSLEAGINGNRLSFTVKPNNKRINRIRLKFSGMSYHNLFPLQHGATVNREDGRYYLVFPRFQEVPHKNLTFQMKGISYVTDQSLHFKIPGWSGKENDSSGKKKKVGEIMGSPLYFAGYSHDLHGPIPMQNIGLKFKWILPNQVKHYAFLYLTPEKQLKEQLEHIPDEKERRRIIRQRTGILTIKNDKGKRPGFIRPRGASTIENTTTIGLLLNQQYVKNTDYLSITIDHLPNYKTINTKKIKLIIPNKGFIGN